MSEMDFRDPFESGSGGGAPAISWPNVGKRKPVKGIILPVQDNGLEKAYRVTQQRSYDPSGPGELLWWDEGKTQPRTQLEITLLTDLTGFEGVSDGARERFEADADAVDDGKRRVFVANKSLMDGLKEACRKAGVSKPEVGGVLSVTLDKKVQAAGAKFPTNIFIVEYTKATPETITKARAAVDDTPDLVPAGAGTDEPPF